MVLAGYELEGTFWRSTEKQFALLFKEVVAVVEDAFNIQVCNSLVVGVVKVMNEVVGMLAERMERRKELSTNYVDPDRGISAFPASKWWRFWNGRLYPLHKADIS